MHRLGPFERIAATNSFPGGGSYDYPVFRTDVTAWLTGRFGSAFVKPGKKAVLIKGNGTSRRDADVLICAEHHEYHRFNSPTDNDIRIGVKFLTVPDNYPIVNFPKYHSAMCTWKHGDTKGNFKPTVRIFRDIRNRMIDQKVLVDGVAPSYYIEGLLLMSESSQFSSNRAATVVNCLNWVKACNKNALMCANGQRPLLANNLPDSWAPALCDHYLQAVEKYWRNWS